MTFRLEHFEGPLDLLLHLISKNKVSIYDIPIADILEQYMAMLDSARSLDMDIAGDFIAMAAQLVYIKSRMLLPMHEEEDEEDPRAQLVEMLLEYQRIKEVTPYFRDRTDRGRDLFTKEPEPRDRARPVEYHHRPEDLVRAARGMMRKAQRRLPPPIHSFSGIVGHEAVPVSAKIAMILRRFLGQTRLHFNRLFDGAHNRSEVVATFLAVLELSKTRRVRIDGEGADATLTLTQPEKEDA
ncbi:MAG: hypothetical protein EOM63_05685 [Clostridia bacterium]|nr:hypothetical protein [Clostridia bacterium]